MRYCRKSYLQRYDNFTSLRYIIALLFNNSNNNGRLKLSHILLGFDRNQELNFALMTVTEGLEHVKIIQPYNGAVCCEGWDVNDASVLCRTLGLPWVTQYKIL